MQERLNKLDFIQLVFPNSLRKKPRVEIYMCELGGECKIDEDASSNLDITDTTNEGKVWRIKSRSSLNIEDKKFKVYFIIDLSPNARFDFLHNFNKLYSNDETVRLELGDKYWCVRECLSNMGNIELYRGGDTLKVFKFQFTGDEKIQQNFFVLRNIIKNNERIKDLVENIGLILLSIGLGLLIEEIGKIKWRRVIKKRASN